MPLIIKLIIAFALSAITVGVSQIPQPTPDMSDTPTDAPYALIGGLGQYQADLWRYVPPVTTTVPAQPVYKHGDCSWLPGLALQAGWSAAPIPQLTKYSLRESWCCHNRSRCYMFDNT